LQLATKLIMLDTMYVMARAAATNPEAMLQITREHQWSQHSINAALMGI
jgi:hypothetical protein